MMFSAFKVIIHITIAIQDMQLFSCYGMNTLYSPGLITSLFGFLPVCIGLAIYLLVKKENRPNIMQWIVAITATVILAFLLINLPEILLGKEDSPYEFTNRGYYEHFGKSYEQDNNLKYFESDTINQ